MHWQVPQTRISFARPEFVDELQEQQKIFPPRFVDGVKILRRYDASAAFTFIGQIEIFEPSSDALVRCDAIVRIVVSEKKKLMKIESRIKNSPTPQ